MDTQATLRRRKWQAGKAGSQPRFCVALFTVGAHIAIAARHDADNAIWIVVEQKRFAENVGIGCEFAPPQTVAQHDLKVVAGGRIVRIECATKLCFYTEHRKITRSDALERDALRLSASGEVDRREAVNRHNLKNAGALKV